MKSQNPTALSLEAAKAKILAKLERAGRRGAPRGGLGFTSTAPYSTLEALEKALGELEQSGDITQVFTRPTPRFFLSKDAPRIERVAEKIAAKAKLKSGRLLTLADLEKAVGAFEKPLAEKAAAQLVQERILVRLRYHARDLYTDADGLRDVLGVGPENKPVAAKPLPSSPTPKPLVPRKKPAQPEAGRPPEEKPARKAPPTPGLDLFGLFGTENGDETPSS